MHCLVIKSNKLRVLIPHKSNKMTTYFTFLSLLLNLRQNKVFYIMDGLSAAIFRFNANNSMPPTTGSNFLGLGIIMLWTDVGKVQGTIKQRKRFCMKCKSSYYLRCTLYFPPVCFVIFRGDSLLALKTSLVWKGSQTSFSMLPPARKMVVTTPISTQEKMMLNPTPLWRRTDRPSGTDKVRNNKRWRCSSSGMGGLEVRKRGIKKEQFALDQYLKLDTNLHSQKQSCCFLYKFQLVESYFILWETILCEKK